MLSRLFAEFNGRFCLLFVIDGERIGTNNI